MTAGSNNRHTDDEVTFEEYFNLFGKEVAEPRFTITGGGTHDIFSIPRQYPASLRVDEMLTLINVVNTDIAMSEREVNHIAACLAYATFLIAFDHETRSRDDLYNICESIGAELTKDETLTKIATVNGDLEGKTAYFLHAIEYPLTSDEYGKYKAILYLFKQSERL